MQNLHCIICLVFFLTCIYVGSQKKGWMGQTLKEIFFTMAPYFKVTTQMGLLKSGKNEGFGSTLKNFSWGFCPTLIF